MPGFVSGGGTGVSGKPVGGSMMASIIIWVDTVSISTSSSSTVEVSNLAVMSSNLAAVVGVTARPANRD